MFGLTPYESKNRSVYAYDPFRDFEKAFFGERAVSEFRTDIVDNGDSFTLEADLPGFKKEDIKVDIDGECLTVSAERHSEYEQKDKKGNYIRCERSYGSYERRFDVSNINTESISGEYTDGVLKLTLPKKQPAAPETKRIELK